MNIIINKRAHSLFIVTLKQNGHPVAYASHALTSPEKQYTVIQRECLAIMFALNQFRHYLLGRPFQNLDRSCPTAVAIHTKMESILCWWALAIQEYVLKLYTAKDHSMPMQMHFLIVQLQMTHCVLPPWLCHNTPCTSFVKLKKQMQSPQNV